MKSILSITARFFIGRLWSSQALGLLGLLLAVTVVGILAAHSDRTGFQRAYSQYPAGEFVMPVSVSDGGTAHRIVWNAISYRQTHSSSGLGGGLLPMRRIALWLAFLLPIIALSASFNGVSADCESGRMHSLLSLPINRRTLGLARLSGECGALVVTLVLGLGGIAFISSALLGIAWTSQQLVRLAAFLTIVGLYVALFFIVGSWISAVARDSAKSLWMATGVFIGLFLVTVVVDNVLAIRGDEFPAPPAVPSDVQGHFMRVGRVGAASGEIPSHVAVYFDDLSAYSEALHDTLQTRYQRERWLGAVSPAHLFFEIAGQLLQDGYANAVDVVHSTRRSSDEPRLDITLASIGPELGWLLVLLLAAFGIGARALERMEV